MCKPSRRAFLAAAAAFCVAPGAARAGASRLAIVDWALLETALAIGALPVAASELVQFRRTVVEPAVPRSVADLGLRGEPNFEMLRLAKPDLVLISPFYEYQRPNLERIAPVLSLAIYDGGAPFEKAASAATEIGRALGRDAAARRLVDEVRAELDVWRGRLAAAGGRPVFVVSIGDARHFRAFGADSMFGDVAERIGLRNAWTASTSYGAAAPVGIEALAGAPDAVIAIVPPVPPDVRRELEAGALWRALAGIHRGRVLWLEPVNHFGGLPAARRFARLLGEAMLKAAANDG